MFGLWESVARRPGIEGGCRLICSLIVSHGIQAECLKARSSAMSRVAVVFGAAVV